MPREITVVLKYPEPANQTAGSKVWARLNDFIRSPLFGFFFGASFIAALPTIKDWFTPERQLELQHVQADARADAILVAPFLANLSADDPGKFQAVRAALQALEKTSRAASPQERPVFVAVNQAIEAVGKQLAPQPDKAKLTPDVIQEINRSAVSAPAPIESVDTSYARLRTASVYLHVNRDKPDQLQIANGFVKTLGSNGVLALGVERIAADKMPNKTQVRYFNPGDRDKAEALASVLGRETGRAVFIAKPELKAEPGTLEVWFGKE